ncbi:MAG TPA: ORF6N domain-containing protein [Bacteroidia bacterium]|nr:ORF6N domain-containing protein [Bacteroidia bacterium]
MKTISTYTDEALLNQIHYLREQKVMFDFDLAVLYGVETKRLKEAVRRNQSRFPEDFMFEMSQKEFQNQRTQNASFNTLKYKPFCFTEQGVAMLSSVLNSERAIEVNIRIIRVFVKMREMVSAHKDILLKVEQIENLVNDHDQHLQNIFKALKQLLNPRKKARVKIGYKTKTASA